MVLLVSSDLKTLLSEAVVVAGVTLWGAEIVNESSNVVLRVYIDKESGVDIDDCELASRHISAVLETENHNASNYMLEVSSPGIYRPLYTIEQYQKYLGQPIKLKLKQPTEELNRKNFSGTLIAVENETIQIEVDGENFYFELSTVAHANLNPDIFKSKSKAR